MKLYQSFKRSNIEKSSIIILLSIIFLTFIATYTTYTKNYEKEKIIFENSANKIPALIEGRMKAYGQVLLSGRAKFYTSENVSREDWKKFVEELKLQKNYPGFQGVGFSLLVNKEDKKSHIENIRNEGYPFYDIKPDGIRDIYTSIIYIEPFDNRNKRAFGYDMFSEEVRNKAMSRAIQTGEYSLSGKVHLVQENGVDEQAGFLTYLPVYKQNMQMFTDEERLKATQGFVYAAFRTKDFLQSIKSKESNNLDIEIYDTRIESYKNLLYDSIPNHNLIDDYFVFYNTLSIGGHEWLIKIKPSIDFFKNTKSYDHYFVFFTGLLVSFFVFTLMNIFHFYEKKKQKYYENLKAMSIRKDLTLKAATIGTWEWKYKDNSMKWDDIMYEIYGIKSLTNKNLFSIWKSCVEDSYKNQVLRSLFKAKKDNLEHNINFWITTPNGERKYIHSIGIVEYDGSRNPKSMVGINIDITEYEGNKQQILKHKEQIEGQKVELETIFNHSKDAIAIVDLKTNFLFFNEAYMNLTGYTKDELLEKNCWDLMFLEDLNRFNQTLRKVLEVGYWENFEVTCLANDNKKVQLIMSIVLLPDKKRFLISSRDFTELKKKEKIIKDYVDLIDKYVITSSTDLRGNIISASEAFCKISGYSKEELIGQNHSIIKHPATSGVYRSMWRELKSNKPWTGELHNITKDGKDYWVKATISPRFDDDGKMIGYIAIREDITDKKIIEQISITDGLTNIYNRRYFNETFPKFIQAAKRKNEMVCFIIIDVDYFKQYNDTYGHQKGDDVLILIAKTLKESLSRAEDYCFRLGGEEFGIVFKSESKEKAYEFAITIKNNIEKEQIEHRKSDVSDFVTISMGLICKYANEIESVEKIYKDTDEFLYKAKESGRNQIFTL